jgi:hypothetical protein
VGKSGVLEHFTACLCPYFANIIIAWGENLPGTSTPSDFTRASMKKKEKKFYNIDARSMFNEHRKYRHVDYFEFTCNICGKKLPSNDRLRLHVHRHTGVPPPPLIFVENWSYADTMIVTLDAFDRLYSWFWVQNRSKTIGYIVQGVSYS